MNWHRPKMWSLRKYRACLHYSNVLDNSYCHHYGHEKLRILNFTGKVLNYHEVTQAHLSQVVYKLGNCNWLPIPKFLSIF